MRIDDVVYMKALDETADRLFIGRHLDDLQAIADDRRGLRKGALNVQPGVNWVKAKGGLPQYIERIAIHLVEKGNSISEAVATAINVVKKACATGDLNYPGIQHENAGSQAEACAAVAEWEALKARA